MVHTLSMHKTIPVAQRSEKSTVGLCKVAIAAQVSYSAKRALQAHTEVAVQSLWLSVAFARRLYVVL